MLDVTLINLARDARSSIEGGGPIPLGPLSADELTTLLDVFSQLDPVQNIKADPEIHVRTKRERYIIRTGQKKLLLYDARRLSEPAYVVSLDEIIAELDGSAAARRTAPPMPFAVREDGQATAGGFFSSEEIPPVPVVPARSWALPLLGVVVLLSGYIAYSELAGNDAAPQPALTALTPTERLSEDSTLTAVYMTGSDPGQHGIVILGDGKLKLFRVNAQAAPSVVHGTYQLGRLGPKLCLATDQPGGMITVAERDSLQYGGETYRRIP